MEKVVQLEGRNPKANYLPKNFSFRYSNNQGRTAANVNLDWKAKNTIKIKTALEQLNNLMTQKTYLFKKQLS